ncbi:helix-turn-helix domain-containing protein [Enterococcus casseliflavus]|uniref:helix-turn-helix domain-containing protein n=1 Tax=Enterococcus casseliflavus TaxID=37734 RepID=UPI0018AA1C66|nr:helix-turn-helix transcriptional regulator [Enterococcus casseliflavus]
MKVDQQRVAEKIREIRTDLGCSMAQFGELISNSPKTTVNNWERGINLPKEDKLKKIALLGKTTVDELLYGTPEEVLTNLLKDHFQLQVNPAFLQQILAFLKQQKVDVYDEMTIMEFLQGIMDSGMLVERNDPYLTYSKVEGTESLYTASAANDPVDPSPRYYAYVDVKNNRVHLLPYTFAKRQKYLYHNLPDLANQVTIDFFTRAFPLLGIDLEKSKIVYYGIERTDESLNIKEYLYNNKKKYFVKYNQDITVYLMFKKEVEKVANYLRGVL